MGQVRTEDIRNIAVCGHGTSGKTSLIEAFLFKAGVTSRAGKAAGDSTVCDYEPDEKERTVNSAVCHLEWEGNWFNFIDTPGAPDFIGDTIGALAAVECVVICIDATAGVKVNTRRAWELAAERGLPLVIAINRLDMDNANWEENVVTIKELFGGKCTPFALPDAAGPGFSKISTLLDSADADEEIKSALIEAIVEADDDLMNKYLESEEISPEKMGGAISKALLGGSLIPMFPVCAAKDIGVKELLDFLASYAPSPATEFARVLHEHGKEEEIPFAPAADGPFRGQVFKIKMDDFTGKISFIRVLSGTLKPASNFQVDRLNKPVKYGPIYNIQGKEMSKPLDEAVAGQIVVVSKVEDLDVSDTLANDRRLSFDRIDFPQPMYSRAVRPKERKDEARISESLEKLASEDQTFKIRRDQQTNELVVSGNSELHLRIMLERLKNRYKVEVSQSAPKIPYQETITRKAFAKYRHKKQTGGRGQFAEVHLRLEPMPLDGEENFQFINEIRSAAIPTQYIPAVEKGVINIMKEGVVAGCQVVKVATAVYDGKHHEVDSSEAAFLVATRNAFRIAFKEGKPVLLEPIVDIAITVPTSMVGDIMGDLSRRRGRITAQDSKGPFQIVQAKVPLAEVQEYATELTSITGDEGSFTMEFSHYDSVPGNIQQDVIARYEASRSKEAE